MFRYYITNTFDGCIEGTDSTEDANDFAQSEDFFVVDSQTGEWMHPDGERVKVKPARITEGEE